MHLQVSHLDEGGEGARHQLEIEERGDPSFREKVIAEQLVVLVEEESGVTWNLDINQLNVCQKLHSFQETPQKRILFPPC